jgi:hypothetical protein
MRKRLMFFAALAVAAVGVSLGAGSALAAGSSVVYNAVPSPLPPNVASVGFEATSTSQFGDYVHLAGTNRLLNSVTVTMSDWALYSDYSTDSRYSGNTATWSHPITVNVYSSHLGANGAPDTLLATRTQNVTIPWRPVADATCATPTAWRSPVDGQCYNGIAFNATFDLSSLSATLPSDVIVGIAYNTADYGQAPIGTAGPYNSLNVGAPTGQTASVGTDDNADNVFWNTSYAPFYNDGGAAGFGIFRQDTHWTPNGTAAIQIAATTCTPTGLMRDGINLTAAQIGGTVTGSLNATGCNIGVYYGPGTTGTVSGANISGANYYGVVANAANVNVTNSSIHNIGEVPFNGSQHGVGVLYTTINQALGTTGPAATGTLSGNTIASYQKNGVVVSGTGAVVTVQNNTVTGNGPVPYIAQNGIQMSYGATGTITGNTVSDNEYTGTNNASSGGIIIVGGAFYSGLPYSTGISVTKNVVTNNDVGVWLSNAQADGSAPVTKTNNKVVSNTISKNNGLTNVSGSGGGCGYQAGIADEGNKDNIVNNTISGNGYVPGSTCPGTFSTAIDPLGNNHINNN